ncbi:proteasomal ATPase-associated factor 1-like [Homarus americanus]|uniref:Proteasomal ATPase-associated factor 1-like n=1 Tax=Homarus americanus TaxID=6706 RepID=A0A8J5JTS2_HOMAM|nr:proteasomal ATPase-associated factor 1-like [Homarus americanus]KAG7161943.1 Proteasomal ATPase-associated factor 1-like [Homarus americanus]
MAGPKSVLVIQSDWHDSLRDNDSSAWILHKPLGQKAVYGKVGGLSTDAVFTVHSRTERTISVTHQPSGLSTVFIAPIATFNNIHSKSVLCLDVANGGLGVSVSTENKLHVWETKSGLVRRVLEGHLFDVYTCSLFPSGLVVLSGGGDMQLRIWDAVTGACPVVLKGHTGAVLDTAIVDRGKNIISVSKDGTAKLWNCAQAKCIATLLKAESIINCCAISDVTGVINLPTPAEVPDELEHCSAGKVLLVGCEEATVYLVAVESRSLMGSFSVGATVLSVCWATSTQGVAGLSDGRLVVIDAVSLTTRPLAHHSTSPVESLTPHCGGILAGRRDGICQFYSLDGSSTYQLTGSDCDPIYKIGTDNNYIYTACRDGMIRKYRSRDINV